jgi:hypothetical protein
VERSPRASDDAGHAEHEQLHAGDGEDDQGTQRKASPQLRVAAVR